MSQAAQRYRELLADWQAVQDGVKVINLGQEDALLERLDEAWWAQTDEERRAWNIETPELDVFAKEPA